MNQKDPQSQFPKTISALDLRLARAILLPPRTPVQHKNKVTSVRISVVRGLVELEIEVDHGWDSPLRLSASDARRVASQLLAGANRIEKQQRVSKP